MRFVFIFITYPQQLRNWYSFHLLFIRKCGTHQAAILCFINISVKIWWILVFTMRNSVSNILAFLSSRVAMITAFVLSHTVTGSPVLTLFAFDWLELNSLHHCWVASSNCTSCIDEHRSEHRDIPYIVSGTTPPYIVSGTTPFRALLLVHFSQCFFERIFVILAKVGQWKE